MLTCVMCTVIMDSYSMNMFHLCCISYRKNIIKDNAYIIERDLL